MYYSSFGMMSLALFILTNHSTIFKKADEEFSPARLKYRYFLISACIYFVTDILWGITYEWPNIPLCYADTVIYFAVMASTVMLWAGFAVEFLNNKSTFNIILKYWGRIMFLIAIVVLIINLFTPIMFSFDSEGVFVPLPARYGNYVSQIVFFTVTAIYDLAIAFKSSGKQKSRYIIIAISGITMTIFISLQTVLPLLPFYSVGCLFASTFIHTFLVMEQERDRNRILADALEAAESANASKTIFLSNMSHEIRTPINTILGMTEIIRRNSTDKEVLGCVENINNAGNRLLAMISDILDFSKIGSGKMEVLNEDYSLQDLIRGIYSLIHIRAEEKGLQITFDIDPILPQRVYGDILKMKQVLTNLLSNAVKFTEKGTIVFRVSQLDKEGEHVKLRFVVIDTGIGIKDDEREKLFKAFNRLDTRRNCTIEGTGLGLTIASDILQLMGAKLCVESTYNVGSTFYFDLIQKVADETPIGRSWNNEPLQDNNSDSNENMKFISPESHILIVDDTELNLKVITGLLRPMQMQVDTASSGEECIEKFASNIYDIVFLDYLMPKMDGVETLAKLRELYPGKTTCTPIISLTASAVTGVREEMLDAGFTDFMTKPVTLAYMTNILLKYLPKSHIHTEKDMAAGTSEPATGGSSLDKIPKALLEIPWINVKEAVEYCGSPEIYMGALHIFIRGMDEKSKLLEDCLDTNDIELFTVTVHSMKSSLLTLGIDELSNKAKELEHLGKQNDTEKIKEKLPEFIDEYLGLKPELSRAMGKE